MIGFRGNTPPGILNMNYRNLNIVAIICLVLSACGLNESFTTADRQIGEFRISAVLNYEVDSKSGIVSVKMFDGLPAGPSLFGSNSSVIPLGKGDSLSIESGGQSTILTRNRNGAPYEASFDATDGEIIELRFIRKGSAVITKSIQFSPSISLTLATSRNEISVDESVRFEIQLQSSSETPIPFVDTEYRQILNGSFCIDTEGMKRPATSVARRPIEFLPDSMTEFEYTGKELRRLFSTLSSDDEMDYCDVITNIEWEIGYVNSSDADNFGIANIAGNPPEYVGFRVRYLSNDSVVRVNYNVR